MPDYKRFDPKGWCGDPQRGAAMGRDDIVPPVAIDRESIPLKFTLRRVKLNQGGYDALGTYFGTGAPLYWAAAEVEVNSCLEPIEMMFRAYDRNDAKARVRIRYPNAQFCR